MTLILVAFFFGILTVLAPCVLPVLPIVIGGSVAGKQSWRPYVIIASLGASILLFSIGLQILSSYFFVDPVYLKSIAVFILIGYGIITLFPQIWEKIKHTLKISEGGGLLSKAGKKQGIWGAVLTGAALGPVFNSCSPTYALIISTVLQQSFAYGVLLLFVYTLGFSLVMLLIAVFGARIVRRLRGAADPKGWFKKALGVLFILVGIAIWQGWDKKIEAYIISQGWYVDTYNLEEQYLNPERKKIRQQQKDEKEAIETGEKQALIPSSLVVLGDSIDFMKCTEPLPFICTEESLCQHITEQS